MHVKMNKVFHYLVLYFVYDVVSSADVFSIPTYWDQQTGICSPVPAGGVEWILHVREPNHGWKADTHRANIALAVNKWKGTNEEMTKMNLQLEEEIINYLLRNGTSVIHENDLALCIHALIATKKNPRNFHGMDLVADLLHRVNSEKNVHPFLVLALCNSHAVEFAHLEKVKTYTEHRDINGPLGTREAEMKALSLKALACAATLPNARSKRLDKFQRAMDDAAKCLIAKQTNGKFGNAYTTSLAVQALTAYGKERWNEEEALQFLRSESSIDVNMIKAYYIEMALNARNVRFIKDLYEGPYDPEKTDIPPEYFTTLTIKDEQDPDVYFSVIMRIPRGWSFFQVMQKASELSNRFRFSYVSNRNREPMIFKVIGKPNDAEENMFWMICRQNLINHTLHTSNITTFADSPVNLQPLVDEHIILWYRNTTCPTS